MTWTPDDALVEKAFNATPLPPMRASREHYRAALIACRDDMVAEAVRAEAEAEACAAIAKHYADRDHEAGVKAQRRANRLGNDPFGHGDMARSAAFELDAAEREARAIEAAIRARHP